MEHKHSGKTGGVMYLEEESTTQDDTEGGKQMYVVEFRGDKRAKRCSKSKLRPNSDTAGQQAIAALGQEQTLRIARQSRKPPRERE